MIFSIIRMLFPKNLFLTYEVWSSSIDWCKNDIYALAEACAKNFSQRLLGLFVAVCYV